MAHGFHAVTHVQYFSLLLPLNVIFAKVKPYYVRLPPQKVTCSVPDGKRMSYWRKTLCCLYIFYINKLLIQGFA